MADFLINKFLIKNHKTGQVVLSKIQNISYLNELPTASEDSADLVSVNNELYVKQVNGATYTYAKVGGSTNISVENSDTLVVGDGGFAKATPIPTDPSVVVENIYFNTSMTPEDVCGVMDTVLPEYSGGMQAGVVYLFADEDLSTAIRLHRMEGPDDNGTTMVIYAILVQNTDDEIFLFAYSLNAAGLAMIENEVGFIGWNPDFNGTLTVNKTNSIFGSLSEYNLGNASANEAAQTILSITDAFTAVEGDISQIVVDGKLYNVKDNAVDMNIITDLVDSKIASKVNVEGELQDNEIIVSSNQDTIKGSGVFVEDLKTIYTLQDSDWIDNMPVNVFDDIVNESKQYTKVYTGEMLIWNILYRNADTLCLTADQPFGTGFAKGFYIYQKSLAVNNTITPAKYLSEHTSVLVPNYTGTTPETPTEVLDQINIGGVLYQVGEKYTAGSGITIENNVISSTGGARLEYLDSVPSTIDETTPNLFVVGERLYYKWEKEVKVYGVDGIGLSSPTLTRTDDNVGLSGTSSELQNFFVADTDVVDSNGNHFVKMKAFFMKITYNSDGSQKWQVSHVKADDSYFRHPFFYDKDGKEIEFAYYGKYKGSVSSSVLKSVSSVSPTYSTTGDNFRTYARANGSDNYHQTDWAAVLLAQCMFMIAHATTKYDRVFTMRQYYATTGNNTQTFFGIEDMVGNGLEFVDGITYSNGTCYYKDFVGQYNGQITSGNSISGIPTGTKYQKNKLYIPNKPISVIFPQNISGASETTYLCDEFYGSASSNRSTWWGSSGTYAFYGVFYLHCNYDRTRNGLGSGARLFAKTLI